MDKQLLKAYIRTVVEDEVKKILPELLSEAVSEIKQLSESASSKQQTMSTKPKVDRARIAQLMGIEYDGQTIKATSTDRLIIPEDAPKNADPEVLKAINKDYSGLMKKMGIV